MHGNVLIVEGYALVPYLNEEVDHDCAQSKIHLGSLFGGGHEIDGYGIHHGLNCSIEDESVLFTILEKILLWSEENVWKKLQDPCQHRYDKVVVFLLVHGFHEVFIKGLFPTIHIGGSSVASSQF